MLERGTGSIVNIASIGGFIAYPHTSAYLATKGGVVQLTRALALEWIGARAGERDRADAVQHADDRGGQATRSTVTSDFIRQRMLARGTARRAARARRSGRVPRERRLVARHRTHASGRRRLPDRLSRWATPPPRRSSSTHADVDDVAPGDVVMLRCDLVLTNDISGPMAIQTLERMGVERVFDPAKVVVVPDHFVPAKDVRSAGLQKRLKDWCDAQGVVLYDQGRGGIEHAVLVEDGWVLPGTVIAGGDSHTCTHGALGAFGTGLGSTDIAACLAYGRFWQAVPATIQVELRGRLGPFIERQGRDPRRDRRARRRGRRLTARYQ